MNEYFKGLIFPKPITGKPVYRYQIVGLLVTDQPILEFEGKDEILLDGTSYLADILPGIRYRECDLRMSPEDFLIGMNDIKFNEEQV